MDTNSNETSVSTPPLFLLLDDGTVWSYDAVEDVSLGAIAASIDHLHAWDSTGRLLVLASDGGDGVAVSATGALHADELRRILVERLRERAVKDVDLLTFDELIFKASIRLVGPTRRNAQTNFFIALFDNVMNIFRGGP